MQSEQLYDYVAVLEDKMADVMDADATRSDQSQEAQEGRAAAFLVTEVGAFVQSGKPLPWVEIAALALAVAGREALEVSAAEDAEEPEGAVYDEIPF